MTPKLLSCYLFFTCLFLSVFSNASMAQAPVGGDISYEYYNNASSQRVYIVKLTLFAAEDPVYSTPKQVELSSSCFTAQNLSLTSYIPDDMIGLPSGGVSFMNQVNCGDTLLKDSMKLVAYYYRDTVDLQGTCSDFKFVYHQCCRDSSIDNISSPSNTEFYLGASLNNTIGPNGSIYFPYAPNCIFYKGVESHVYKVGVEPDGDSVLYQYVSAKDFNGASVNYLPGFTPGNPIASSTSMQPNAWPSNTLPTVAGEFVVTYEAVEYRYSSALLMWFEISRSMREMIYFVKDTFPDYVVPNAFGGKNVIDTIRNVYCQDSTISFRVDDFWTSSLMEDASDFRLIGVDSLIKPIVKAGVYWSYGGVSDSIWLKLHRPLSKNDTVFILLKKGSDGNSLVNLCGVEFPTLDTGVLIIQDCQYTGADEYSTPQFSLYPNPSKDKVTLEFEAGETPESITIYNLQGKEMEHEIMPSLKTELNISSFPKGMYLIKVSSGNNFSTQLFQKD